MHSALGPWALQHIYQDRLYKLYSGKWQFLFEIKKSFLIMLYQHLQEIWVQTSAWKIRKCVFNSVKTKKKCKVDWILPKFLFFNFCHFCRGFLWKFKRKILKSSKIVKTFPSWQRFVFVTVFKIFGFEISIFEQWSCGILERYCIEVPTFVIKVETN